VSPQTADKDSVSAISCFCSHSRFLCEIYICRPWWQQHWEFLISALPLLEWQSCIIYAPVRTSHLLWKSGIPRRWQLLLGWEIQTCSVADLWVDGAFWLLVFYLRRLSLVFLVRWCWSATGQAPDW